MATYEKFWLVLKQKADNYFFFVHMTSDTPPGKGWSFQKNCTHMLHFLFLDPWGTCPPRGLIQSGIPRYMDNADVHIRKFVCLPSCSASPLLREMHLRICGILAILPAESKKLLYNGNNGKLKYCLR